MLLFLSSRSLIRRGCYYDIYSARAVSSDRARSKNTGALLLLEIGFLDFELQASHEYFLSYPRFEEIELWINRYLSVTESDEGKNH